MANSVRIGILGGGISGLATAFFLLQESRDKSREIEISLLERSGRLGGVIRSENNRGFLLEWGPEAFVSYKPAARELVHTVGLSGQLIGSNDHLRRTYVLGQEGLRPLPEGMAFLAPIRLRTFWSTSSLSRSGKLRALMEPFVGRSQGDLSVSSFLGRRLGKEFTDSIAEPLVSAIYGGDIRRLSTPSALPLLHQLEQSFGSLWKGFRRTRSTSSAASPSLFQTLRGGIEQLIDPLVRALEGVEVHLNLAELRLERGSRPYRLRATGFDDSFDLLILSTPAGSSAEILSDINPEASGLLREIPYTSSKIIYLAYKRSEFSHPLDGFGFVVPEGEAEALDACTWVSSKFDGRCPEQAVLLRCVAHDGRMTRAPVSKEEAAAIVHGEVRRILNVSCAPVLQQVFDHTRVMPQLVVGHRGLLEKVQKALERNPGLFLTGAFVGGVGIPDCIQTARRTAQKAVDMVERLT